MKNFFLACLFPTLLTAQAMDLTEQLGKTVLYGDISLSADGKNVAWAQSTAATTLKQTYVRAAAGDVSATKIDIGGGEGRIDADPTWSPDSKTLAFLSTAGSKDQRQLWTANADGSASKQLTQLKGYAARPRWSHDGKQIAF